MADKKNNKRNNRNNDDDFNPKFKKRKSSRMKKRLTEETFKRLCLHRLKEESDRKSDTNLFVGAKMGFTS